MTDYRSADFDRAYSQLCHLAALSASGRVEAALDNLSLTTLSLNPLLGTGALEISDGIFDLFGLRPPSDDIKRSLERLTEAGSLVYDGSVWVPTAEAQEAIIDRARAAAELESKVRAEWHSALVASGLGDRLPPEESMWECLQGFMARVFRRHGAQTLSLLAPDLPVLSGEFRLKAFLAEARADAGIEEFDEELVAAAVESFFNSVSDYRAQYLVQLLDGTFTFFALTVDDVTAEFLRGRVRPISLFLDTNFIFAILDLHVSYFTDVSGELLALVRDQGLPFTLYYHERTLREMRNTIAAYGSRLKGRRWSRELSRAAVTYGSETAALSGVELAFHRLNADSPTDPEIFLGQFDHIESLLEDTGFKVYRETADLGYSTEEKGRLVADYDGFVTAARPDRPKPYEALDHDVVVLMRVDRLRKSKTSLLEAGALFLTNDFLLHRFAWRFLRAPGEIGPTVLPRQLLQVLRPFVPATDDFDRRFAEAFAIPEFRSLQPNYGPVASNILSYLSTYRDLPEQTALRILGDTVLQNRLRGVAEESAEFGDAVETAIVSQNRDLLDEVDELRASLESSAAVASATVAETMRARADLEARIKQLEETAQQGQAHFADARKEQEVLRQELATAKAHEQVLQKSATRTSILLRWAVLIAVLGLGAAVIWLLPALGILPLLGDHPKEGGLKIALSTMWAAIAWAIVMRRHLGVVFAAVVVGGIFTIAQMIDSPPS